MKSIDFSSTISLILLAFSILIFPIHWILGWILACLIHEVGHFLALELLGEKALSFRFKSWGMEMICPPLPALRQIFCSLAGPVFSIALISVSRFYPALAVCGVLQGCFNLLPISPLDGSVILRSLCRLIFSPILAERIFLICQCVISMVLIILLAAYNGSTITLIFVICIILKKYSLQT